MKLTYLINKIDYGGAEIGAVRLLSGLDEDEFDITLVTLKEINSDLREEIPDFVTIIELKLNSDPSIRRLLKVREHIAKADVLVGSLFPSILLGSIVGTALRVPRIYVWRHNTTNIGRIRKAMNQLSFRLSEGVLADSESTRRLVSQWGVDDAKISVLPLSGVDTNEFPTVEYTPSDTVRIGTVGRLVNQKGYPELVECAKQLPEHEFHVIGDGPLAEYLSQSPSNVITHGHVEQEELYRLWDSFDVYFQPSRHEGLCITAIEAMACGLPVVASDVNGLSESVIDGETGYLIDQGNIKDYCQHLERLANDVDLRAQFGTAGKRRIEKRYSMDTLASKFKKAVK